LRGTPWEVPFFSLSDLPNFRAANRELSHCNRHPIEVNPLYFSVPATTHLDFYPPKSSADFAHDTDVIPLPFLVHQSDCLHPISLWKNLFFHSQDFPLFKHHTSQIGEGGLSLIQIPKTSIEIESGKFCLKVIQISSMSSDAIRNNLNECMTKYDYYSKGVFSVALCMEENHFRMLHERSTSDPTGFSCLGACSQFPTLTWPEASPKHRHKTTHECPMVYEKCRPPGLHSTSKPSGNYYNEKLAIKFYDNIENNR
ncbi:hypothetical protein TNCV_5038311, partial [Trichonephila clavipes]